MMAKPANALFHTPNRRLLDQQPSNLFLRLDF